MGPPGPTCPEGYGLQAPAWDPDALVCMKDSPEDDGSGNGGETPQAAALDPRRMQYA